MTFVFSFKTWFFRFILFSSIFFFYKTGVLLPSFSFLYLLNWKCGEWKMVFKKYIGCSLVEVKAFGE